jgi:uncharacterized protein YpmS
MFRKKEKITWKKRLFWIIIILAALLCGTVDNISLPEWRENQIEKMIKIEAKWRSWMQYSKELTLGKTE